MTFQQFFDIIKEMMPIMQYIYPMFGMVIIIDSVYIIRSLF